MKSAPQVAILCGGRGERLKPLSDYFQKVMIPIGPKKLPLLAYVIALMKSHGMTNIALLTGYRSEDIRRYFGDGSNVGVKMSYSEDPKGLKGSLNAVANALKNGTIQDCDELIVYYGDVLTDLDVSALLATHRKKKADATLVLAKGYILPVGMAKVDDNGLVAEFKEKPRIDLNVNLGTLVVGPKAMKTIQDLSGPDSTDLMTHFLPRLLASGGKVAAYYAGNQWYDVGTVSSFEHLDKDLARNPFSFTP